MFITLVLPLASRYLASGNPPTNRPSRESTGRIFFHKNMTLAESNISKRTNFTDINRNLAEVRVLNCKICSLYICVKNMDRAIKFYEDFFEQPITERDNLYSVFDINGFRFGLFAYQIVKEKHIFGSNCLPSISVDNIETLKMKIQNKEICFPLTQIGKHWVVEFVDSEGNHIEMTTPV